MKRNLGRERSGHTEPRVNEAVQNSLLQLVPQISLKMNCAKVYNIVNALKEIYKEMKIRGTQAWRDYRNIINSVPETMSKVKQFHPLLRDSKEWQY